MSHPPRPTIRDVARVAGVSVATVSNVMAGRAKFSDETRSRVEQAIRDLRYHPEAAARNLKLRRTQTIGLLIPIMEGTGFLQDNPFYWDLVCAVEAAAREVGYRIMLAQIEPDDDLAFVVERNLDGLIMLGAYDDYPALIRARALGIPVVLIDSYVQGYGAQVRIDDYAGGQMAAQHLIGLGHTHIGAITGTRRHGGVHFERCRGFRDALQAAGVQYRPEWVLEGPVSFQGGEQLGDLLLSGAADGANRPTAIFASADNLALGFLTIARRHGVAVPEQLSVIGFDDIPLGRFSAPGLTTIRQDTTAKGAASVRLIRAASGTTHGHLVTVGIQLVVRESTAPPRP